MPASPRPRRLHHWGHQCPHLHCTRVHSKRPQMPTSPCARAQFKMRASKKMPASTRAQKNARVATSYARGRMRESASLRASKRMPASPRLARVQEDARVATSYARLPMARVKDARVGHVIPASAFPRVEGRVYFDACKDARVACYLAPKMAASEAVTEFETRSCRLLLSSHVLPHDEEQREEGVWL